MSFLFGKGSANPSNADCAIYKECLEFVISNLKFSLVHHNARVDGTMVNAWKQEKEMLQDQINILEKFPGSITENKVKKFKAEIDGIDQMVGLSADPNEMKRLNGMCDMHTGFVRSLEAMIPLLKEKCPNQNWNVTVEEQYDLNLSKKI
eukprot:TRINITY_DN4335_c0_g1_i1.p1 TRINITY_DN4335_c0_g1~~TRINITY_DN4335_c0_g1_i1.p1  ORF type:complete len:149 (-),score=27.44 TRINITY_DN4335_c0_g1_i1:202-648(-)